MSDDDFKAVVDALADLADMVDDLAREAFDANPGHEATFERISRRASRLRGRMQGLGDVLDEAGRAPTRGEGGRRD